MRWVSRIALVALVAFACVGAVYLRSALDLPWPRISHGAVVRHSVPAPTIGQVRQLAALVTLDVPITDIHVASLEGLTGSTRIAVAVAGDVQIATNLERAEMIGVDERERSAVLRLARPAPGRPRIDHERTRILQIERRGLWKVMPGDSGEKAVTDLAMREAQRRLLAAADKPELIEQACARTERVVGDFFGALGWSVAVQWDDAAAPDSPHQ